MNAIVIEGWDSPVHPAANLFPMMSDEDIDALAKSIREQGLRQPIILTEDGQLLDGRNRVAACSRAGVPPRHEVYRGNDPVAYVMALNMDRRHLTTGQKAMLALKIEPMYEAEGLARKSAAGRSAAPGKPHKDVADLPHLSQRAPLARDKAGAAVKVSGRAVAQAKRVAESAPDLAQRVESGEMALDRAEREVKSREAKERERRRQDEASQLAISGTHFEIRRGEFQSVLADLEPNSVDLIVTDPPYGDRYTDLYGDLAKFAAEKLKPGGSCIAYVGQGNLPGVMQSMASHLRYWWTLALIHKHGGQQLPGKWVMVEWKPLVWFVKETRAGREYVADRMAGSKPRKELHEWAQGVDEVAYLIEKTTEAGALVVDPFAGSGSFGHAAKSLGRNFIGAESGDHKDAR